MADGERVPVRLVQENGNTISLDATSIDMVVERQQSAFGIPLADAKKMAIDLNQAMVGFEIQGVFTDDKGQEASSSAKAVVDLSYTQRLISQEAKDAYFSSLMNKGKPGKEKQSTGNKGAALSSIHLPKKKKPKEWRLWDKRYISLPVAYWVEQNALGLNQPPVTSGLDVRFAADTIVAADTAGGALIDGATVSLWKSTVVDTDGFPIVAVKDGNPLYKENGAGGQPYVYFDGSSKFALGIDEKLNPADMTIFAVAKTTSDNGSGQTIINSQIGAQDKGYSLVYNMGSSDNDLRFIHYNSGTTTLDSTPIDPIWYARISTIAVPASGTKYLYLDGVLHDTDSAAFNNADGDCQSFIGAGAADGNANPFVGEIYEILVYNRVLSNDEREKVEGYLSDKYSIPVETFTGRHPYSNFNYVDNSNSLKVLFDVNRVTTKNEPYGFVNKPRPMTGITVSSTTGYNSTSVTFTVNTTGGDPRDWMEVDESKQYYHIKFKDPATGNFRSHSTTGDLLIKVTAVAATSITCETVTGLGSTLASQDQIWLAPLQDLGPEYVSSPSGNPVLVLPIQNAFASLTSLGEDLTYVSYPDYEDGGTRSIGKSEIPTHTNIPFDGKRADEYITYLLSQLLISTLEISERAVNAAGDKTMNKVFTTSIKSSGDGFKTRLEITQVHATSLGTVNNQIIHNFDVGNAPNIQGFTGGKSGKKVKSAGDKVQDILGILGNSNNFDSAKTNSSLGNFIIDIATKATDIFYGERDNSDYIFAIQIPYDTNVTKGNSSLDAQVAQRNHWVMTDNASTFEKMSVSNDTHASKQYALEHDDSRRNGIHGIITDFHVHRDAEMKAYEFALKFVAANVII
tara:strand:+ start:16690 stop:19248 length:2559 start_codon:yes stop_codon:yes gene_type:complete